MEEQHCEPTTTQIPATTEQADSQSLFVQTSKEDVIKIVHETFAEFKDLFADLIKNNIESPKASIKRKATPGPKKRGRPPKQDSKPKKEEACDEPQEEPVEQPKPAKGKQKIIKPIVAKKLPLRVKGGKLKING